MQPQGGSIADIALTEPLRKIGDVADTLSFGDFVINRWDEDWEVGGISAITGQNDNTANRIRSKNYISVLFGESIYVKTPSSNNFIYLRFYDSQYRFITYSSYGYANQTIIINNLLAPKSIENVAYVRLHIQETEYGNDICINTNNSNINGTYYPYDLSKLGYLLGKLTREVEENDVELDVLAEEDVSYVEVPQIAEADSYTCEISQGAKAVSWSSFTTNSE